jgi:hydrogenase maturation protease
MKTIVVGLGNPLLQDDGIGPYLVERLKDEKVLCEVEYYLTAESGMYLVEKLVGYERALIIDSIKTEAAHWGQVWLLTAEDFAVTVPGSAHGIDLFTAVRFMRNSGVNMPHQIGILAVGVQSNTLFSEHFSSAIEQCKETIYQQVKSKAVEFFAQEVSFYA